MDVNITDIVAFQILEAVTNSSLNRYRRDLVTSTPNTRDFPVRQDGSINVPKIHHVLTCAIGVAYPWSVYFCATVMLEPLFFLTAASCVSGIGFGRLRLAVDCWPGETHGYFHYDFSQLIVDSVYHQEFTDLDLKWLRKRDIAIVQVQPPIRFDTKWFTDRMPFNEAALANNSKEKRQTDLYKYYSDCLIHTYDEDRGRKFAGGREPKFKWDSDLITLNAEVISREECANRNMEVMEDEFCLIIVRKRNGPCKIALGAPIVCGEFGVLEGILSNVIGKCNETGRLFIGTRVDNYRHLIDKFLARGERVPETPQPGPATSTTEKLILFGQVQFDMWLLFYSFIAAFVLVLLFLLAFLYYTCRCDAINRLMPRYTPQKEAAFTLSVNIILPLFVLFCRVTQYCRLRQSVENDCMKRMEMMEAFVEEAQNDKKKNSCAGQKLEEARAASGL